MKCPNCGEEIGTSSNFCEYCGAKATNNGKKPQVVWIVVLGVFVAMAVLIILFYSHSTFYYNKKCHNIEDDAIEEIFKKVCYYGNDFEKAFDSVCRGLKEEYRCGDGWLYEIEEIVKGRLRDECPNEWNREESSPSTPSVSTTPTAQTVIQHGYVDLGLPSGTLWMDCNENGFYSYEEALNQYGNTLPSRVQWKELTTECQWSWTGSGYEVTGPNGNSIELPACGIRNCSGDIREVGTNGYYCSSSPNGDCCTWRLLFRSDEIEVERSGRCYGRSVRLVKIKVQ